MVARPEPQPRRDSPQAEESAQAKGQGAKVAPPGRQDRQESTPVQKNADRRTGQGKEKRVSEHRPKSTSNPILEDLRHKIRDRQVLVIVGAGVSIASSNRAPVASWVGLLQHGVQRVVDLECEDTDWKEPRVGRFRTAWRDPVSIEVHNRMAAEGDHFKVAVKATEVPGFAMERTVALLCNTSARVWCSRQRSLLE